jgi:hypothetical protein
MMLEIQVLAWDRHTNVSRYWLGTDTQMCPGTGLGQTHKCVQVFNWLTGSQFLLDNWISNIYKQTMLEKTSTYLLPLKEKKSPHTIIKMNDNINMDSTAGSMIACI